MEISQFFNGVPIASIFALMDFSMSVKIDQDSDELNSEMTVCVTM